MTRFVDIKVQIRKQPLAPWPRDQNLKRVGAMALSASQTGYHAYGMGKHYIYILHPCPSARLHQLEPGLRPLFLFLFFLASFTRILGMDFDEADRICQAAIAAVKNKNTHAYAPL